MATFSWDETINAPRSTVFAVLTDHRGIPNITKVRKAELEREGDPAPNGLGAIRKLTAVGPPLREEVIEWVEDEKFAYKLLSGAPLRDHVGTVTLTDAGEGRTRMQYRVDTTPTVPLVGGAVVAVVKFAVGDIVNGVVKESERRSSSVA
jgi:uncharacterized protein YndB with AHSA1/START domain